MIVVVKSAGELATMREAGRIVATTLAAVAAAAVPGCRLLDLDDLAADRIAAAGAKSSFLGYHPDWAPVPYPAVLCLSVDDAIVHAIPDGRRLRAGELLSIDFAVQYDGLHADAAITVPVADVDDAGRQLIDTTARALDAGIAAARPGSRLGDIGYAVQSVARAAGYGQPVGLGGHGIGTEMHEDPSVSNTGRPGRGLPRPRGPSPRRHSPPTTSSRCGPAPTRVASWSCGTRCSAAPASPSTTWPGRAAASP